MNRDPFKPEPKHRKPRRTVRRAVAGSVAAVALGAAVVAATGPAQAATSYRYTRDDARLCAALAAFNSAGLPSNGDLVRVARLSLRATAPFRADGTALAAAVIGGGSFRSEDDALAVDCHPDW